MKCGHPAHTNSNLKIRIKILDAEIRISYSGLIRALRAFVVNKYFHSVATFPASITRTAVAHDRPGATDVLRAVD